MPATPLATRAPRESRRVGCEQELLAILRGVVQNFGGFRVSECGKIMISGILEQF